MSDDAWERLDLTHPFRHLLHAGQPPHVPCLLVDLLQCGVQLLRIAPRQLGHRVDARRLQQTGVLRADAFDAEEIEVIDPRL
ncbi:MAG TPA: hypothetical protein VK879_01500 [Candidatus Sulfomarinibacteraceae bacterium]|nr:hypothetical protein [Candidatus Sulfomarinibacteraceae bacterium]